MRRQPDWDEDDWALARAFDGDDVTLPEPRIDVDELPDHGPEACDDAAWPDGTLDAEDDDEYEDDYDESPETRAILRDRARLLFDAEMRGDL
jgi:hypothetical protein